MSLPRWLWPAVLLLQLALVAVFLVSPKLAVVLGAGVLVAGVVVERPVLGVGLIVASRVLSTEGLTVARVGPVGLGLYEGVALLCLPVLLRELLRRELSSVLRWPWQAPLLALLGWGAVGLAWSRNPAEGLGDLLPALPVLFNTALVLLFVKDLDDLKTVLWCWLGASVLVCLLTVALNLAGVDIGVGFEAAAGGGRETGLGQQPNWFAMTLYFIVPTAFALGWFERGPRRLAIWAAGALVFLGMVSSGSRGGLAATGIALLVASLGSARVRRSLVRLGLAGGVGLAFAFLFAGQGLSRAIGRIAAGAGVMANVRPWNWQACAEMAVSSKGLGIGLGGYSEALATINPWLANSIYDYPHGVPWQVLAHLGVVGVALLGWGVIRGVRMLRQTASAAPAGPVRTLALVMAGTLAGYAAWTFFEFTLLEKPFFEFLALATALHVVVRR